VVKGTDLVRRTFEAMNRRARLGKESTCCFGFPMLDEAIKLGLPPRNLSLVVARPGFGKTTLLANLLRYRMSRKRSTTICGWEMDPDEYVQMAASSELNLPVLSMTSELDDLPPNQHELLKMAVGIYGDGDLVEFQEMPFLRLPRIAKPWERNERNLEYLEATVEQAANDGRTLIAVDVIGKLFAMRTPDAMTDALVRIRAMAKHYDIHIMLLHHMNRTSADGPPTLEGIKNSGAFEEEADLILALDRPNQRSVHLRRRSREDSIDIHVLKQRKGPFPLCFRYRFDGPTYSLLDETEKDVAMLYRDEGVQV
jgi:replicative DNA helicase